MSLCAPLWCLRDFWYRMLQVILNEHHVFLGAYLFCPWLIDCWVHCCFQEGRVRVTLLARSTEYRRILNQVEVSSASPSLPLFVSFYLFCFYILFLGICRMSSFSFLPCLSLSLFIFLSLSSPSTTPPLPPPPPPAIDLLPTSVKCLFKILLAINSMSKKGLWFKLLLPISVCAFIDHRTCRPVVTAGKRPQDCASTGGQCGGLQIQVSYRVLNTKQELFSTASYRSVMEQFWIRIKTMLSFSHCLIVTVFTQRRWLMCKYLSVFQGCSLPGAAEDHTQLWHLHRDARRRSHPPPLPPWLGCHLWAVSDIFWQRVRARRAVCTP